MSEVEISNPEGSLLVSDLLSGVAELARARGVPVSETTRTTGSDYKTAEMLATIALGVASSAAYDMLKAVVARFAKRKDYDEHAHVVVNNVTVEIQQLLPTAGVRSQQPAVQHSGTEENAVLPADPDER